MGALGDAYQRIQRVGGLKPLTDTISAVIQERQRQNALKQIQDVYNKASGQIKNYWNPDVQNSYGTGQVNSAQIPIYNQPKGSYSRNAKGNVVNNSAILPIAKPAGMDTPANGMSQEAKNEFNNLPTSQTITPVNPAEAEKQSALAKIGFGKSLADLIARNPGYAPELSQYDNLLEQQIKAESPIPPKIINTAYGALTTEADPYTGKIIGQISNPKQYLGVTKHTKTDNYGNPLITVKDGVKYMQTEYDYPNGEKQIISQPIHPDTAGERLNWDKQKDRRDHDPQIIIDSAKANIAEIDKELNPAITAKQIDGGNGKFIPNPIYLKLQEDRLKENRILNIAQAKLNSKNNSSSSSKKSSKFVEGQTYTDKYGHKGKFVNGQMVEVK